MASSFQVGNRLLDAASAAEATLTPMQLLKLVYICHGWTLGLYHEPLISDEIQAWRYGPVIPRLYGQIRDYRSDPIEGRLPKRILFSSAEMSELQEQLVDEVFEKYGHLSGLTLSKMTHQPGTPWALTYDPDLPNKTIPNDLIEQHYVMLAEHSSVNQD